MPSGGSHTERWSAAAVRHLFLHHLSFFSPVLGFLFVVTGPHAGWLPLWFLMPMLAMDFADRFFVRSETRQPPEDMPKLPFDLMLYVLFGLQVVTVVGAARLVSQVGFFSLDGLLLLLIVPGSSAFSIITAHELIHRREKRFRTMGRIMMGLVLYEHFYTEHVRGHHVRVGTSEDPATARFGETFAFSALEVVNYFEHWGLVRQGKRVQPVDSWDTTSLVTLYALVGLSRHADHHAYATRPFQQLRHWDESPKLPRGYPGMLRLALGNNRKFQALMTDELERRQLGPFADGAGVEARSS